MAFSNKRYSMSLFLKLLLLSGAVNIACAALLIINSMRLAENSLIEQAYSHIEQLNPILQTSLGGPLVERDFATLRNIIGELRERHSLQSLALLDHRNELLLDGGWDAQRKPLPALDQALQANINFDKDCFFSTLPIQVSGQHAGTLLYAISVAFLEQTKTRLWQQGLIIAALGLAVSLLILGVIGYWLTRHLRQLTSASQQIAAGHYNVQVPVGTQDEVGALSHAFNRMADTIKSRVSDLIHSEQLQKQYLADMRQEHARLDALLSIMDIGILFVDLNGKIIYVNPSFTRIWRIGDTTELVGKSASELLFRSGMPISDHLSRKQTVRRSQRTDIETVDGRSVTQLLCPVWQGISETITGYLWVYEDVTAQRKAERELAASNSELQRAKEVAEAASEAKSRFLANMSHEIRTPMNGILGMAELLLKGELSQPQRELASGLYRSADSLLAIINDILDFSRIEAGKLTLSYSHFQLQETIDDVMELLSHQAQLKNLDFSYQIAPETPLYLFGDAGRLRQILINITGNALKFTSVGGVKLTVSLEKSWRDEAVIRFEIQDTGIGIALKDQRGIFDSFAQGDPSTTRKFGGSGLGLTISRQLVQLMGGEIGLHSEPGKGSTFWFTARFGKAKTPAAETPVPKPKEKPKSPVGFSEPSVVTLREANSDNDSGCKILLAEDNPVNQMVAREMLTMLKCQVDLVNNGQEALQAVCDKSYDLVLMDCQMPILDGYEATRRIRQWEAAQASAPHIPIVALTANAMAEDRAKCLAAGMDDYLSKPFLAKDLEAILERWRD